MQSLRFGRTQNLGSTQVSDITQRLDRIINIFEGTTHSFLIFFREERIPLLIEYFLRLFIV